MRIQLATPKGAPRAPGCVLLFHDVERLLATIRFALKRREGHQPQVEHGNHENRERRSDFNERSDSVRFRSGSK
jgi:hypothetical protein